MSRRRWGGEGGRVGKYQREGKESESESEAEAAAAAEKLRGD